MKQKNNIEILDCTLRDGGYINNWWFEKSMVREVYRSLSKCGVDYIELGFRGTEKYFSPEVYGPWRFTTEEDLQEVTKGIEGAKIAIMGDYGKIDLDDLDDKKNSFAAMVRIAAHKDSILNAVDLLEKIKAKGYITSLQTMGFTGYTEKEKNALRNRIKDSGIDYFYIADSYGSMFPHDMKQVFEPFLEIINIKIGFHPHNSLQMAFANTLEAIKIGVHIVDGSIFGMGRGSGNLPTEALIAYMEVQGNSKYNVIPLLNCIDRYFTSLKKEMPWGYQLPFLISGIFQCHPYYATELIKRRAHTIEDIWKMLEIIEEINPVGFDNEIIDKLIRRGIAGNPGVTTLNGASSGLKRPDSGNGQEVPYINRHEGSDFLVLANGPSLKKNREEIQTFINKYNPVIIGANYLSNLFEPDYHAFQNKVRFEMYVDKASSKSKLLIGENIPQENVLEYVQRDYETLFFRDILDADFDIIKGRIQSNCHTISVLLLGVAIVMGAKRIFVAGMDGYVGKNSGRESLFYNETFDPKEHDLNVERHRWNEKFLHQIDSYLREEDKEDLHIITPTSHSSFYKGIENYI